MPYSVLTFTLNREQNGVYSVALNYSTPASDIDLEDNVGTTAFDAARLDQLSELALDIGANKEEYSKTLTEGLFSDVRVKTAFATALSSSAAAKLPIRVRISVRDSAEALHGLYWELLLDPKDGSLLSADANRPFSRFLRPDDWRPVPPRRRREFRALVAIASPSDLGDYNSLDDSTRRLAPLDVPAEKQRADAGLKGMSVTTLASGGDSASAPSLGNIIERLNEGYDILYLVCHGDRRKGSPRIWLEKEDGKADIVDANAFIASLTALDKRPRLAVLVSCKSASSGDEAAIYTGALSGLGPQMASGGVAAVLAMQGNIELPTVEKFLPIFFEELRRDGQLDRALSVARNKVRDRDDSWMPVLFMQLKSGMLWDGTGFGEDFRKWPFLLDAIDSGRCTPILGSGLNANILGSSKDIAMRWAKEYKYPMAGYERTNLPEVAQYVVTTQPSAGFLRRQLARAVSDALMARFKKLLTPEEAQASEVQAGAKDLDRLISAVGKVHRDHDPDEPYKVLARLPFPIYITTTADNLLTDALEAEDRSPQHVLWPQDRASVDSDSDDDWPQSVYTTDPKHKPTPQEPLLYHSFGNLKRPSSIVLTKDEYFDYLIDVTVNHKQIPSVIPSALVNTTLLFLGFGIDDWDFRVFFRTIMKLQGEVRRKRNIHVAVQINPQQEQDVDLEGARLYLEEYFGIADVKVYWGSVEEFIHELRVRWEDYKRDRG